MTLAVSIAQGGANNVTFRNKLINGACVIDQRNAGASVTPTSDDTYTLDRWKARLSSASKFSVQQQTSVVPTGFTNALKVTSLATTSLGASDYYLIQQNIEGFNVADLGWGTANAKTVTISAWVYSSLTGTFGGVITNSSFARSYPFSYTISSANTWTQISVTIAGDTSGTWLTTNGIGMQVVFSLGMGSTYSGTAGAWVSATLLSVTGATSVVGTSGATFYITGVQLEAGTTASPFEYRQYGLELALCQRYYYSIFYGMSSLNGNESINMWCSTASSAATASAYGTINFPVSMRTYPSLYANSGSGYYRIQNANYYSFNTLAINDYYTNGALIYNGSGLSGSATIGYSYFFRTFVASASAPYYGGAMPYIAFSAEL